MHISKSVLAHMPGIKMSMMVPALKEFSSKRKVPVCARALQLVKPTEEITPVEMAAMDSTRVEARTETEKAQSQEEQSQLGWGEHS